MEFIELLMLLQDTEVERVTEAGRQVILVRDVSEVLVDLGIPPILGIPRDLCMVGDVLEMVGVILEHLQEAYASSHGPWVRCRSFVTVASIIRHVLVFSFVFILFLVCKIFQRLSVFYISILLDLSPPSLA
jgi:hypothetical protein